MYKQGSFESSTQTAPDVISAANRLKELLQLTKSKAEAVRAKFDQYSSLWRDDISLSVEVGLK